MLKPNVVAKREKAKRTNKHLRHLLQSTGFESSERGCSPGVMTISCGYILRLMCCSKMSS